MKELRQVVDKLFHEDNLLQIVILLIKIAQEIIWTLFNSISQTKLKLFRGGGER